MVITDAFGCVRDGDAALFESRQESLHDVESAIVEAREVGMWRPAAAPGIKPLELRLPLFGSR